MHPSHGGMRGESIQVAHGRREDVHGASDERSWGMGRLAGGPRDGQIDQVFDRARRNGRPSSLHRRAWGERQRGFTLGEVLVALALSLLVIAAILAFQGFQLQALSDQAEQIDIQGTARSVVDLIAREVRKTGRNPACNAAIGGLEVATSRWMRIQTDVDGDGLISKPGEDVSYGWDPGASALFRIDHKSFGESGVLVQGVDLTGSALHYFDGSGNELVPGSTGLDLAQRRQVRRVRLDLAMTEVAPRRNEMAARARVSTNLDLRNRFFVSQNSLCTPTVALPTVPPRTPQPTPTCVPSGAECVDDAQCCKTQCKKNNNPPDPNMLEYFTCN